MPACVFAYRPRLRGFAPKAIVLNPNAYDGACVELRRVSLVAPLR